MENKFGTKLIFAGGLIDILKKGFTIWPQEHFEYENEDLYSYKLTKPYCLDEDEMLPTITSIHLIDTNIGYIDDITPAVSLLIEIDFPNESDLIQLKQR